MRPSRAKSASKTSRPKPRIIAFYFLALVVRITASHRRTTRWCEHNAHTLLGANPEGAPLHRVRG